VKSGCKISQSVIFSGVTIGEKAKLTKVIIDKGCKIPAGMVVGEDAVLDAKRFFRTEKGVVVITKTMLEAL
jgi:glucose-1-phosphate adenylyltransferase